VEPLVANVVQEVVRFLVQVAVGVATIGLVAVPALLLFPATRVAIGEWLSGRRVAGRDDGDVHAQLAAANAQLTALRSEIYALRREITDAPALKAMPVPVSLSPPALEVMDH
jgi:hypothetical protein